MSKKHDKLTDESVGYGRPPKASQFKKGQSGNPRGRPRKAAADKSPPEHWGTSIGAIGRIAYEPVTVMLNGKETSIPMIEAVHRRRMHDALKGGNRLLQREVIAQADAHEQEELRMEVQRFLRLREEKAKGEVLLAQAKAKGLPEPTLVPHPHDIFIDEETTTATVDGPETQSDLLRLNFIIALRDHCVIRAVYQRRFPPLLHPFTDQDFENLRSLAEGANNALCARLRWGKFGFGEAMHPYEKKGFRFLEADLKRSHAALEEVWANEPALESGRNDKHLAKAMTSLLAFKNRSRERTLWQIAYKRHRAMLSFVFGEERVAHLPKLLPTLSHAESTAMVERLTPEQLAEDDRVVAMLKDAGFSIKS